MVEGFSSNAEQVAAVLIEYGARVQVGAPRVVRHHSVVLLGAVRSAASGRPGPRVVTGGYRASWTIRPGRGAGGGVSGAVVTSAPMARRLEFGFVGRDSAGRFYRQRPYPHAGRALAQAAPGYLAGMARVVKP